MPTMARVGAFHSLNSVVTIQHLANFIGRAASLVSVCLCPQVISPNNIFLYPLRVGKTHRKLHPAVMMKSLLAFNMPDTAADPCVLR